MPYFEFLERLRKATAQYHDSLEKSPVSVQLLSPSVTNRQYADYLLASYNLHAPVEHELFPLLSGTIDDLDKRKKTPAIKADLDELGVAVWADEQFWNGETCTPAFCLGVMYVLEGSTLGGLHIVKAVLQNLGSTAPIHFLTVYGNSAGQRWKHFLSLLYGFTQNSPAAQQDEIINGALFAFKKANVYFNNTYATNKL